MVQRTCFAALIVGLLATAAGWAGAGEVTPRLEVEQSSLDLGRVVSGSTVTATFVFHNHASSPVRILRAAPS